MVTKSQILAGLPLNLDINPLLDRLFLDHDIIFYFLGNIEKIHDISKASKGFIMY